MNVENKDATKKQIKDFHVSLNGKKQIIFIEPKVNIYSYRIARTLKLTGKYETVLVSFSKVDKQFFSEAYDKIFVLELSHKINFKDLSGFFRTVLSKKGRDFFKIMRKMRPWLFQLTGPDLFSAMAIFLLKGPKVYLAYDIWCADNRNFLFTKNPGIKGYFQEFFEKICFRMSKGAIHKTHPDELKLMPYKLNTPTISFVPGCLYEWTYSSVKKKNKEIHLGWAGWPLDEEDGRFSFLKVVKIITSQKIHFHVFGPCIHEKEEREFRREASKNKYFHIHEKMNPKGLNEKIAEYDYGILPVFIDDSVDQKLLDAEMPQKFFNYIEAGIPIIVPKQKKFMMDIIKENGIGFGINLKDLENLREIIMKQDYGKMKRNLKKAQEKFDLRKMIKELEKFYEVVVEMKKR